MAADEPIERSTSRGWRGATGMGAKSPAIACGAASKSTAPTAARSPLTNTHGPSSQASWCGVCSCEVSECSDSQAWSIAANNYPLIAFLTSGFVGGLVYWLFSGRMAAMSNTTATPVRTGTPLAASSKTGPGGRPVAPQKQ